MKLELRPRGMKEVVTYFHKTVDPEINAMLPRTVTTLEQAVENYQKSQLPSSTSFGRSIYADGKHIGDIWCYCMEKGGSPEAMVSFCIFEKSLWGCGLTTLAAAQFLEEVRNDFGLHTFGAFCYAANTASRRVLEKNCFRCLETFSGDGAESCYYEITFPE